MSRFRVLFWLLPRRLRASWGLLAITSFGTLAAVTFLAVGAIYSRALAEGGLRHVLASYDATVLNGQIIAQNRPLGPADYRKLRATVEETIQARLGYLQRDTQRYGRSQPNLPLVFTLGERGPALDGPVGRPFFLTGFEQHSRIVQGRWPEAAPVLHRQGLDLEVAVGRRVASSMGLRLGAQVFLVPFRTDLTERIALTVVGLVEPVDPLEEYWMYSSTSYFNVQEYDQRALVPFYVPEEAFFNGLGTRYPSLVGDYGWFLYFDTGVLTAGLAKPTRDAILGLETDLNKRFPRTLLLTGLKPTLAEYQRDLAYARVPIFLYISLLVVVILYFLALVMGLLAGTRSDEASFLRSRGASVLQVSGLLAAGEGVVALVAMALGPFLALGIVRYGLLGTINPAGGGSPLSVGLSADMFVMGALGGLLSFGVLLASGVGLGRLGIVEFLRVRARPPTVPFLHRYYVDLLVVAAVGLVWWQVETRGGFIERAVSDESMTVDPSLLLGPALALLAAAFLVLRIWPMLLRLLAWTANRLSGAWAAFPLVRVARDPLTHGSLAIVVMLAAALGVFGATFQATLSTSQREQALYNLGGDLVIKGSVGYSAPVQDELAAVPGVGTVSPVGRHSTTLLDGLLHIPGTLLAVDSGTLPQVAWFRDDFAGKSLRELLLPLGPGRNPSSGMGRDPAQGIPIPVGADRVGVWVRRDLISRSPFEPELNLLARLYDGQGRYDTLSLGSLRPPSAAGAAAPGQAPSAGPVLSPSDGRIEGSGHARSTGSGQDWTYLEAPLSVGQGPVEPPASLVSILLSGSSLSRMAPGRISLDDITAKGPGIPPGGVVIEGYEEPGRWVALPNTGQVADTAERTREAARSGRAGLALSWREPWSSAPRGVFIPPGPFPLPAIGGPTSRVGQELRVQSGGQLIPVVIRDVTDYFPTADPLLGPFLLMGLADYRQYLERTPGGTYPPPKEFWATLERGADRSQVVRNIRERLPDLVSVQDRAAQVDLAQRDPLAGGGWNSLTLLSVIALTGVVVLALSIHAAVSVHTARVDLTVARALGFSQRQLFLSLALERVVLAVLGVVGGSAIGIGLGRWVLGFLDHTATGRPIIPPMTPTLHGWLVALILVNLVAAAFLAILLAALAARRLRAPDILRAG